jgi:hypothetical protein
VASGIKRFGIVLVVCAALFGGHASGASAGLLSGACGDRTMVRPFPFDISTYFLAPNGDFENATAEWTTAGGASVSSPNEPLRVGGSDDSSSLYLPAGASATSTPVCVGLDGPTIRFFAKNNGLPLFSSLKVEAIYKTALGLQASTPVPVLYTPVGNGWLLSLPSLYLGNTTGLLSLDGLTTDVTFRFTAKGGSWRIDDVYVDPWRCI